MQVAFAQSYLAGDAMNCAPNLKLHDPNVFGSLDIFKTLLSATFQSPRAEFKILSELPEINQGKCKVHAYVQHVRYLDSCRVAYPVSKYLLIV